MIGGCETGIFSCFHILAKRGANRGGGDFHHTLALNGQKVKSLRRPAGLFHHKIEITQCCGEISLAEAWDEGSGRNHFLLNQAFSGFCGELFRESTPSILLFRRIHSGCGEIHPSGRFQKKCKSPQMRKNHVLW